MSIEKNIFCNTEQPTTVQIVTTGMFFHRINFMWCFRSNLHNSNLANGVTNISMTILSVISGNNSQGQCTTVNIPGYLHSARHVAYITATALNRLFLLSEYNTESLQWWTKLCLKKCPGLTGYRLNIYPPIFLQFLAYVISRDSKIGCRYNFLKYLSLLLTL